MKRIRNRAVIAFGCYGALGLWLVLTNPQDLPIALLMVPFVLLLAALWLSVGVVLDRFFPKMLRARRTAIVASLSVAPVFLLVLGSVDQLTWRDALLVLLLAAFIYFYSGRARFLKRN